MRTVLLALFLMCASPGFAKMVVGEKPTPPKAPPPVYGYDLLARGQKKLAEAREKQNIDPHTYHYCKAIAWLQFAKELLELNPHDGNANHAVNEAIRIAEQLETGKVNDLLGGIFSDYKILRVGLWDAAQHFQPVPGKPCGPCFRGQLEVQMVAVGHQANKSGDDVAQELIEVAEELEQQMKKPTRSCLVVQDEIVKIDPTKPIAKPAPTNAPIEIVDQGELLAFKERYKDIRFYFHSAGHTINNIVNALTYKSFRQNLSDDMLFKKLVLSGQLNKVKMIGHSDATKPADYQKKISTDRANQILKDLKPLLGGVDVEAVGIASKQLIRKCSADEKSCNLYNNRVEILFEFAK